MSNVFAAASVAGLSNQPSSVGASTPTPVPVGSPGGKPIKQQQWNLLLRPLSMSKAQAAFVVVLVLCALALFIPSTISIPSHDRAISDVDPTAAMSVAARLVELASNQAAVNASYKRRSMQLVHLLEPGLRLEDLVGIAPRKPAAVCELFMIGHPQCHIAQGTETMIECIRRYGHDEWTRVLQPQCTRSAFWKSLRETTSLRGTDDSRPTLRLDPVAEAHLGRDDEHPAGSSRPHRPVPVENRSYALPHPPLQCPYGLVYPLGFCAPASLFMQLGEEVGDAVEPLFPKVFEWFPSIPSRFPPHRGSSTKKYLASRSDEYVMRMVQRLSMFAWTHMRGGPDCLRHHEILAAGAVPYFPDLLLLPKERVSMLPRSDLEAVFDLPGVRHIGVAAHPFPQFTANGSLIGHRSPLQGIADDVPWSSPYFYRADDMSSMWHELRFWDVDPHLHLFLHMNFKRLGDVDWSSFDVDQYERLSSKLLRFTKKHLGCHAVAATVLKVLQKEMPSHVMYIGPEKVDYQSVLLEMGLAELGVRYSVHKPGQHHRRPLRKEMGERRPTSGEEYLRWLAGDHETYYGHGFGTSRRIPLPHVISLEEELCSSLRRGEFDVWIYSHPWPRRSGDGLTSFVCFDDVVRLAKAGRIAAAFVDGGDGPSSSGFPGLAASGLTIFAREASC